MHLLTRICLQNWYLIDAMDIELQGATALVGPTGAGKSSIQDAIQTVITGANQNRLHLNPSASGRSARSVLEYCLGLTKDPSEGGKPLRSSCESVLALVFRDEETGEPVTVGVALSARQGDSREEVLSRFIASGFAYSVSVAKRREGSTETLAPWSEIAEGMRKSCPQMEEYRTSSEKFTADVLKAMRGSGHTPNVRHFLRSFSNALAFKPIFDPTVFVRDFVLEPDPLDVGRVRASIETWQELERIIEDVEARLRRVARMNERFRGWGRARMKAEASRYAAAAAETRRTAREVHALKELHRKKAADLAAERAALATRRQWIRELDDEISSKRVLAQSGEGASRIRQIELETQLADRDGKEAAARYGRIRQAFSTLSQLGPVADCMNPRQSRAYLAAREALAMMPEGVAGDSMHGKGEALQSLADAAAEIEGLEQALQDRADALVDELRSLQAEVERMEQASARGDGSGAVLSYGPSRLLAELSRNGMEAVPLCDVVEVEDESWQYAIESLLGMGREAIIVPPDRLDEAFDTMWRDRDAYSGCTLVKTTSTASLDVRTPKGSVLEAVRTQNAHAAAFLAVRIGSFRKAEDEAELSRLERGVMRNGKTSSGMGLSVQRNLKELLLGRRAKPQSGETLRNELRDAQNRLNALRSTVRLMKEAGRAIPEAVETLRNGEGPYHLEHALRSVRQRLQSLASSRNDLEGGGSDSLLSDIESLERDRRLYADEIAEEIEPAVERLQGEAASAAARLEAATEALRSATKARRKAWLSLSATEVQKILRLDPEIDEPDCYGASRRIRADIKRGEAEKKDAKAWLSSFRNDSRAIGDNVEAEARREQAGAIREMAEYAANWQADVPVVDPDTMTVGYAWAVGERARLENNELRRHREACAKASEEMRRMLKEDLLSRLAEKLEKVGHRIEALNALLARHRFTGQVYSFESEVNLQFQRMHDLAMKFGSKANSDAPGSLDDKEISEAVAELEGMIEGVETAATLADYRQYFTFEIAMTDADGGRTTMSTRAVKGSGGEAQAPFYVAIAASLASAYFPGHASGRPAGMGLALFDEAFNKLDVPNTQALLAFFRDIGLQLMIAGPEDKRATFTEAVDTMVLVNKSLDGSSVYVDVEYPGALARKALGEINPDHAGVEAFKAAG